MNLDDKAMLEMREKVFNDYRDCISRIKELETVMNGMSKQAESVRREIQTHYNIQSELKTLIDIMIEQDCDPVLAKLKYSEIVTQHKEQSGVKLAADSTYGYDFSTRYSYDVGFDATMKYR